MTDHAKSADERKTKKQLIRELKSLRRKVADTDLLLAELIRNYKEAPIGLCYFDTNLRFLHINDWLAGINGMPVEEHLGRTISEVLPDVAAGVESQLRRVIETGEPIVGGTVDAKTPAHPGPTRTFEHNYFPIKSGDDTVVGVSCVVQEITERKRAEEALLLTQFAIDHASDAVYWLDRDGRIVYANDTVDSMLGYSRKELLGLSVPEYDPDATLEDFSRAFERIKKSGSSTFEARHRAKDGTIVPVEVSMYYLKYGDKELMACITRDITERKAAGERARQHEAELAHVLRVSTMGEMATALAHELNQPLAAVVNFCRGSVRRIKSGKWNAAELVKALDEAGAEAERAGQIVHGIRSFVRKLEPKTGPEDINAIVRATMNLAGAEVRENEVTLRLDLADGLPPVVVDATEIEQVVLNLLRNGIEAMMESRVRDRKLTTRTSMGSDGSVEVGVSDKGPGLPAELGSRVFEPFISTKPGGMGMGLSISRTIVEAHGGTISANANDGGGATFRFTLPVASEASGDDS